MTPNFFTYSENQIIDSKKNPANFFPSDVSVKLLRLTPTVNKRAYIFIILVYLLNFCLFAPTKR